MLIVCCSGVIVCSLYFAQHTLLKCSYVAQYVTHYYRMLLNAPCNAHCTLLNAHCMLFTAHVCCTTFIVRNYVAQCSL